MPPLREAARVLFHLRAIGFFLRGNCAFCPALSAQPHQVSVTVGLIHPVILQLGADRRDHAAGAEGVAAVFAIDGFILVQDAGGFRGVAVVVDAWLQLDDLFRADLRARPALDAVGFDEF